MTMVGTIMINTKGFGSIKSLDSQENLSSKVYLEKKRQFNILLLTS